MPDDYPMLRALIDSTAPIPAVPILRVDAKAALAELERFRGVVAACMRTREKQRELEQAWEYLFANKHRVEVFRDGDEVTANCFRRGSDDYYATAATRNEAIIALVEAVAESSETADTTEA